jgi:hypothetical protein
VGRTLRGAGVLGAVATGLSVVAASCGGGPSSPGVASDVSSTSIPATASAASLEFSRCMRSHGVASFPDPNANGGSRTGHSSSIDGIAVPSSLDLQSSAFQAALRSCRQVLSGGAPPPLTERQKQATLATAQCIRRHGFPAWPDPQFDKGEIGISTDDVDVRSPAFKRAAAICGTP